MSTLQDIKNRCRIDDITKCWVWTGAMSEGRYPRVHAPDLSKGGIKKVQTGPRAVWQAVTSKQIPCGHRVYHATCTNEACLNPAHLACGPTGEWGATVAKHGTWKHQPKRIQANRATGRKRSAVDLQTLREIQTSEETGKAIAERLQIGMTIVSRVRRGTMTSLMEVSNPFAGLML